MDGEAVANPVVLIADDEKLNRRLVRLFLEGQGYTVIEAANGRQALELARANQPALVLVDVHMTDISGFEVAQQLKTDAATRHIKVALISAQNRPADQMQAQAIGADAYLYRLLDWGVIMQRVRELVGGSP